MAQQQDTGTMIIQAVYIKKKRSGFQTKTAVGKKRSKMSPPFKSFV